MDHYVTEIVRDSQGDSYQSAKNIGWVGLLFKAVMKRYNWKQPPYSFYRTNIYNTVFASVCQGWFHLHGLARAARNTKQARIKHWTFLPTVGFEPGTFRLINRRATNCATRLDICDMDHYVTEIVRDSEGDSYVQSKVHTGWAGIHFFVWLHLQNRLSNKKLYRWKWPWVTLKCWKWTQVDF